ncbi:MAG: hypothetical protein JO076_06395, partial [Verrucomicrobia bacterium]|nr:hypothetical protein [Verrucomicrobiota bacterium]
MEQTALEKKPRLSFSLRQLLKLQLLLVERLRLRGRQTILAWAAFIGFSGAIVSEGFRKASELIHWIFTGSNTGIVSDFITLSWWQRLLVPAVGGLFAGLTLWIGNRLIASVRQKSTTDYMEAIVIGNGFISLRASLVKAISALFSISTGSSIGR